MSGSGKAAKFVKEVAGQGGAKGVALARKAANHKAVDKAVDKAVQGAADKAAAAVIGFATGGAGAAIARRRGKRANRRYVRDLARQVGGSYSYDVIIGSGRYCVVWIDDAPYRVVPDLPESAGPLEELPDIQNFRGVRHKPA
jgi:hypothetical protein